jgi:hypothetical protein
MGIKRDASVENSTLPQNTDRMHCEHSHIQTKGKKTRKIKSIKRKRRIRRGGGDDDASVVSESNDFPVDRRIFKGA